MECLRTIGTGEELLLPGLYQLPASRYSTCQTWRIDKSDRFCTQTTKPYLSDLGKVAPRSLQRISMFPTELGMYSRTMELQFGRGQAFHFGITNKTEIQMLETLNNLTLSL